MTTLKALLIVGTFFFVLTAIQNTNGTDAALGVVYGTIMAIMFCAITNRK